MVKPQKLMTIKKTVFVFIFLFLIKTVSNAQVIGDYISIGSGNWTLGSTWGVVTGTGPLTWSVAPGGPTAGNNVFVRSGHVVFIPVGSAYFCTDLTVEASGQLYTANSTPGNNTYINVSGNILCNGQIGNTPTFDNISFNIESSNCTISGAGLFDACRLRKNGSAVVTTNLTINMNINLWFSTSSATQLYNNSTNGVFNVTISAGSTVNLLANGASLGHASIDGINGVINSSASTVDAGGTFTINGSLIVTGTMYFSNNNSNSTTYKCNWIVNGLLRVSEISAGASANVNSGSSLTVNSGGKLEITGTNAWSSLSPTNNTFNFASGSTEEYSASGPQTVRVATEFGGITAPFQYGNLIVSNSGNKTCTVAGLYVKNDLTISGSAVLIPVVSSTIFVGGSWYNWGQAGFTENLSTVRFNNASSVGQSINCPGGEVYYILIQNSSNNILTFNCAVTAYQAQLANANGHIDLNSNALTITNPLQVGILGGGINRYIISEKTDNSSKVTWQIGTNTGTYTIPFGVLPASAANYIPVYLVKTTATALGDITISTYGTPANNQPWPTTPTAVSNLQAYNGIYNTPDNRSWCVDRFWQINSTGMGVLDSLKFTYRTIELPTSDPVPGNMKAQFWAGAFGYWNLNQYGIASVSGSPVLNTVSVPSFSIYNTAWTLSSLTSPLPIELLYFGATKHTNSVLINWSTATEINNELFVLERSNDGMNFYPIGKVEGAGNSTQELDYSFSDITPLEGVSYYRIKQIDFDGAFSYSQTVAVNFDDDSDRFTVFPNPASSQLYITKNNLSNSQIIISDITGRILKTEKVSQSTQDIFSVEIGDLLPGVYSIEVIGYNKRESTRFVKN